MQIKIMAADEMSAFRVELAQPDGEATTEEAASPQLALGAARIPFGQLVGGAGSREPVSGPGLRTDGGGA
jgi:hypothetical protein